MRKTLKYMLLVLCVLLFSTGSSSALSYYYESYEGYQEVSEGDFLYFGFDFWYSNDQYEMGTNSDLQLTHDEDRMYSDETWLSANLSITLTSDDDDVEWAVVTFTALGEYMNEAGEWDMDFYVFDAGTGETKYYSYALEGGLLTSFQAWGWGFVTLWPALIPFYENDFAVTKVAMEVTTDGRDQSPIPEPATLALLGLGLVGFAVMSRKQRLI